MRIGGTENEKGCKPTEDNIIINFLSTASTFSRICGNSIKRVESHLFFYWYGLIDSNGYGLCYRLCNKYKFKVKENTQNEEI